MKKQKGKFLKRTGEDNSFSYFSQDYLSDVLDQILIDVKDDNDSLILVDGIEGGGKSVFAACSCKYLDNTFNEERLCFGAEDFFAIADSLKKERFKAVQYDEAVAGLLATDFMKEEHKRLIKMLSMSRKRNLIIFMCVPSIKLLSSHIINHRAKGLVHVFKKEGRERGYAKYYNRIAMADLHDDLKKYGARAYEFHTPDLRINFNTQSVKHFKEFIDIEKYGNNKDKAIDRVVGFRSGNIWKDRILLLMKELHNNKGMTQLEISKIINIPASHVSGLLRGVV